MNILNVIVTSFKNNFIKYTYTAEMRFLRPMAGYTLLDKKRSSDIRETLGIFNINDKLTQYKINWREHIQRMDDNRLPKKTLSYKPEGRRNIGRPQTRWGNYFREEGPGQGA